MIKAIISFAVVLAIALGAVWLAEHPGTVTIHWLGLRVEMTIAMALALLVAGLVALYVAARLALWGLSKVTSLSHFFANRRQRRARKALTRGLVALATGDVTTARRVIRDASRLPDEKPLLLLLEAQTAERTGETETAERVYREMLDHPVTEVLGLTGLVRLLRERGETEQALEYAGRAYALQPANADAFRTLFAMQIAAEAWSDARGTIDAAKRAQVLTPEEARRRNAVIHLAEAQAAREADEPNRALSAAQKGLSLAPDLIPAAITASDILRNLGRANRARTIIEAMWRIAPHPELGRIYGQLKPKQSAEERWRSVQGLTEINKQHTESRILFARHAIAAKKYLAARDALMPLAQGQPTARVAELMARLEELENRDKAAAEQWMTTAAHAPRDALWSCRECGRQTGQWTPVCAGCGSFDSKFWKASGDQTLFAEEIETIDETGTTGLPVLAPPAADPEPKPKPKPGDEPDTGPRDAPETLLLDTPADAPEAEDTAAEAPSPALPAPAAARKARRKSPSFFGSSGSASPPEHDKPAEKSEKAG